MERIEMVEKLREKANVSYEEAQEALEKSNWDILDAMIYLEKQGKVKTLEINNVIVSDEAKNNDNEKKTEKCGGIGSVIGRFFKFLGNLISKGNINYFEIKRGEEKPIKISLTITIILLILAFWPVAILLVIGLFMGYKYSIVGPNIKSPVVNDIMSKASSSAENIKSDFQEGYKN
ncbi:MAG: DUF4342 domain-containing protein [Clostridiales bacterium]|mgnify:CR=1 FL=1|nr:DUF4342 domain-containing protein [Clostridiales bacterium]